MTDTKKVEYYDLRAEALSRKLPIHIGRSEELERLNRVIDRRINNNVLIVGPDGTGKTTLVYSWIRHLSTHEKYASYALLQFDIEHVYTLEDDYSSGERYAEALSSLPSCVVFIDDFGRQVYRNANLIQRISRLYKQTLKKQNVHVILTLTPHEYSWLAQEDPAFVHLFETIQLKSQSRPEYIRILGKSLPRLNARHRVIVSGPALEEAVAFAERFPVLGQLPQSAIRLLDEAISHSASKKSSVLTHDSIAHVVEAKTGIPKARLTQDELESVKRLEHNLNARIIDQTGAIAKIATTLQRAKLGLRNPNRPLGSFLLLGPSGVGKTETAKSLAEILFGRAESFIRYDMSEFQQDHTVQRLIGAPAGYVGYEEGGALTNALKREPHSLILLDEIEKAHPKVFDIFLQVLDDGRLTSGQNETVDARNAVVMATSNAAVQEILHVYSLYGDMHDEVLLKEKIMPTLTKTFRLEFLNRFDSILIFKPLTVPSLVQIAELEIKKIEKRLAKHRVRFAIDPHILHEQIQHMVDPRFGARPVKRFVEDTCETLLVQSLLNGASI